MDIARFPPSATSESDSSSSEHSDSPRVYYTRARPSDVYQLDGVERVALLPRLSLSELMYVNGLVRTVCRYATDVMLVAHRRHATAVRHLYGDVKNVRFTFVTSWSQVYGGDSGSAAGGVIADLEGRGYRVVPLPSFREACPYALLGLEVALARGLFAVERQPSREADLLRRVVEAVGNTFIVVHEDEERRLNPACLPDGLPIVRVRDPAFRAANLFEWVQVLDHAIQVHGIDSCVLLLADFLRLRPRKFLHAYCDATTNHARYEDVTVIWTAE